MSTSIHCEEKSPTLTKGQMLIPCFRRVLQVLAKEVLGEEDVKAVVTTFGIDVQAFANNTLKYLVPPYKDGNLESYIAAEVKAFPVKLKVFWDPKVLGGNAERMTAIVDKMLAVKNHDKIIKLLLPPLKQACKTLI